jgi:hypothetical protein
MGLGVDPGKKLKEYPPHLKAAARGLALTSSRQFNPEISPK